MLQRGGSINYFPLPDTITNGTELEKSVAFVNVVGHGSLTGSVFKVPDNTFILFMGAAGYPIVRRPYQLPTLKQYRFLKADETVPQWYDRQYSDIRSNKFFSDMLYKNAAPFAPDTTAIYEPGDIIQDLSLSFENNNHPFLLLGVWNCPIPNETTVAFDSTNQGIQVAKETYSAAQKEAQELTSQINSGALPANNDDVMLQLTQVVSQAEEAEKQMNALEGKGKLFQDSLPVHPNNIEGQLRLGNLGKSTLHEVVKNLSYSAVGQKRIRFIVVEACRATNVAFGMEALQHIFRLNKPMPTSKAVRNEITRYEQSAFQRRRASLFSRRAPLVSNGAAGGAADMEVYTVPAFRYAMSDFERVVDSVPAAKPLIAELKAGQSVQLESLEAAFAEYIKTGRNLVAANLNTLVSGVAKHLQFLPGELVSLQGKVDAIVLTPTLDEGAVKYEVAHIASNGSGTARAKVAPIVLRKLEDADGSKKELLIGLLASFGFDADAEIAKLAADRLARLQAARAAVGSFAATLPAPKAAATKWNSWSTIPDAAVKAAFEALPPNQQFASGEKAVVNDTLPNNAFKNQPVTVIGLEGISKDGVFKGLAYKVLNDYGKERKVRPDHLVARAAGGRRIAYTRRRKSTSK